MITLKSALGTRRVCAASPHGSLELAHLHVYLILVVALGLLLLAHATGRKLLDGGWRGLGAVANLDGQFLVNGHQFGKLGAFAQAQVTT
ncbi:hypothetical protein JOE11_005076 [Robbsia andropogonis]|uniref:hypothetical protein n=1 Tax=Robbsia andropogonis TaxID=28092 RepID=UPI003D199DD2